MTRCIPVVDVFAGCGGLSEGFAQHTDSDVSYDIVLGLDSDPFAHETHLLRSFFHQFPTGKAPEQYYSVLRGEIGTDELYNSFPDESTAATNRIKHWELGGEGHPDENLHSLIEEAVDTRENWVLIGGPPCQAYSTAGRSRNNGKINYEAAKDHRNFLYREYLKILREHRPPVFLLENVPGLLSSKIDGRHVWHLMLEDLMDPSVTESEVSEPSIDGSLDGYRIYSLVTPDRGLDIFGVPTLDRDEFVVRCEEYGIPQSRHRVFLLGVRADIDIQPGLLQPVGKKINAGDILNGLPSLRSGLSRASDLDDNWIAAVNDALEADWWNGYVDDLGIREEVSRQLKRVRKPRSGRGGSFVPRKQIRKPKSLAGWYVDERLRGICNHETKAHMKSDLHRYLFATCHARVSKGAIRLSHFPDGLLPDHENVKGLPRNKLSHSNFADRFAVLLNDKPAHTVVSHIAKDGHYYIHPDPTQCRSLTVREAARLQTFPDNYYFMGNRTEQYRQVGNAVPPLLSIQIAGIVSDLLTRARSGD